VSDAAKFTDAELLARFQASVNQPKGSATLGFRMIAIDQALQQVEATFEAREAFCNPMGQIQGGYLCAMLDDVMSVAGLVVSGMTHVMPTLEMKTSFLRPALPGQTLRALGRIVKWGKTIAFTEGELYGADGRLLAKATGTAMPTPFASFKK
jgi:uncharacterized protein (TIGR00369 family)